ncbi:hypothetical protein, partial [Staphylococcus aureus]
PENIVVMGIDYGLKADLEQMANPDANRRTGKSYTSAVILRATGPNIFNIEYATIFKKNDPVYKKDLIEQLIRDFGVKLTIGDIGFSQDFSHTLHMEQGDKYLVSRAM